MTDKEIIKQLEKELKAKDKIIRILKEGNLVTLCRIPKNEKAPFRIAIRREYPRFQNNISGFVKYCIEQTVNKKYEKFINI